MTNAEIKTYLLDHCEEDYRAFSAKLVPGVSDMLGVRLPILRKLARTVARGDWREYLQGAQSGAFEERMLHGLVIGYADMDAAARRAALDDFIPIIDNWSVCDCCCNTYKFMADAPDEWMEYLLPMIGDAREYHVRFAVVCMLDHFVRKDAELARRSLDAFAAVRHEGYYAKMAAAWAIAEVAAAQPEMARALLSQGSLDDFTHNMAIRKACESNRVSGEMKQAFRALRRSSRRREGAK